MGFCGKEPPNEDLFGSFNLEKNGKQTPLPPSTPPSEIKKEAAEEMYLFSIHHF